jgi:chromosome partitioning protein
MQKFDVIIFDCPPRMTTGTISAVCASTHVLIPTVLDVMSTRAVAPTIETLKKLTAALNPKIELVGAVGNLTREKERSRDENIQFREVEALMHRLWGPSAKMFDRTIPRRVVVSKADDIPYLETDTRVDFHDLFKELGDEIAKELARSDEPKPDPQPEAPPPALAGLGLEPAK